tara:strand:+ start:87 stop:767 length:681 start_codon:yes stop_codon:yes gene_type:complete
MFSIVIPLYNEEENIIPLINEIFLALKEYDSYEIILVDDFSNDQTLKLISNKNNKLLKILQNKKRKGQSYSIYKGVKTSQFDTIITLDGDGQNNPKDIPKLLNIFDQNHKIELVGGLRVKRKDNLIKVISSKIANKIRLIILKDKCKDTGCSLKVFNKNVFLSFQYFDGMHRFLPALFNGFGYETFFVDVEHRPRLHGKSKYGTLLRLIAGIKDIIKVKKMIKSNK